AVRLLNALGYRVIVPAWQCCGRPALSKGLLPHARQQASRLIQSIWKYAQEGYPIIGLEPSCLFTLRDDYLGLIKPQGEQERQLKQIMAQSFTLDEFLAQLVDKGAFQLPFQGTKRTIKVHGHCYQKALIGMNSTLKV